MQITVAYRAIPESPGWATGDAMVRAFNVLGHNAVPYARTHRDGWPIARTRREVNLLLMMECNDADPQYLELACADCYRVMWEFDTSMHALFTADFVRAMRPNDMYFANATMMPLVPGSKYLPYAVDNGLFFDGGHKRSGAIMIGSPFPERVKFCKDAGVNFKTGIFREEYSLAMQCAEIVVHNFDSGGDGLIVMRPFEAMACGALLLAPRTPAMDREFLPGVHYVEYNNADECRNRISYYMSSDEAREEGRRIATAGHDLVMEKHTYIRRAQEILARMPT